MREGNLQYALLGLIAYRPEGVHGYQLKHEAEALCEDPWEVNYGRIYRLLDILEHSGHLNRVDEIQTGRPNRKVYRITTKGMNKVNDWLRQPAADDAFPVRDEIAMKLMFVDGNDISRIADLFEQQRVVYLNRLRRVARRQRVLRKAGLTEDITRLIIDSAEMRVKAELMWLERVERRLLRSG